MAPYTAAADNRHTSAPASDAMIHTAAKPNAKAPAKYRNPSLTFHLLVAIVTAIHGCSCARPWGQQNRARLLRKPFRHQTKLTASTAFE
jgi:hypothetical protein